MPGLGDVRLGLLYVGGLASLGCWLCWAGQEEDLALVLVWDGGEVVVGSALGGTGWGLC
jgi:hypothetical protein